MDENNNDILTDEENKAIADYERENQQAEIFFKKQRRVIMLGERIYKLYINGLIRRNFWAKGASDQPDIYAFNKYKEYKRYMAEFAKYRKIDLDVYNPPARDKQQYIFLKGFIQDAEAIINARKAKEKRDYENVALTGNNEITNTLLTINTSEQTPHNNALDDGTPIYYETEAHALDKEGRLNVQLQVANWCNGWGLHLLLIIYDKLVKQAQRTTTGDKIAYVYKQSLKDFGKKSTGLLIEIPISDIERIMGIQYTKRNRYNLRNSIEKAGEQIKGVYFKVTGELTGWDTLVYRMLYNSDTKNYEILVSSFMRRWAEIGAYFPIHKEIFKLDYRNPYASPLYVKLCEQINYPQANKARLDGYKNSIRIQTLLKGIGLDKAYTLSKDATQVKESLVKALEALSKEAKDFEWVITGDGLATRTMSDFNKLWLCFNLPNVERFVRKRAQVLEIPEEAPAPENA